MEAANLGRVVAWGENYAGQATVPSGLSGVKAIAAGNYHTVALRSDGTVVAWGDNGNYPSPTTIPVGLNEVSAIAAGYGHTVALKGDGTLVAWGAGINPVSSGSLPHYGQSIIPAGLSAVTAIAAGAYHTVALKSDGTVVAWGWNDYGQTTIPPGLSGVIGIAAGYAHTVALKSDGTVVAWGYYRFDQTTVPVGLGGVTAIAAGYAHTVALKGDGTVVAWGAGATNTGIDSDYGQSMVPVNLSGVTAIAAGAYHTVALKSDGTVVAWGWNDRGQTTLPASLSDGMAIAAGYKHTVALVPAPPSFAVPPQSLTVNTTSNATLSATVLGTPPFSYQWRMNGLNVTGATNASLTLSNLRTNQAGNYTLLVTNAYGSVTSSVAVLTVNRLAQAINFGSLLRKRVDDAPFSLAATASSGLPVGYACFNAGVATVNGNLVTLEGAGGTAIIASQAGDATYLPAIDVSQLLFVTGSPGVVVAWGDNGWGQTNVPIGLSDVVAIAASSYHAAALKSDGTVTAWGHPAYANVPVGLSGVVAVAAGPSRTVALKNDGAVVAWGADGYYQTTVSAVLSGVTAIAAGGQHTVALKSDGTVVAWGDNTYGQTNVPAGLRDVTAIAAGDSHTVALKRDGTLMAWGAGANPDFTRFPPSCGQSIIPAGLSAVTAIAAGAYHTVALKNGTLEAWGWNDGQTATPDGLVGVTAIAAGYGHTLALRSDGTVTAWGRLYDGGSKVPSGLAGVTAIAAGGSYSVALRRTVEVAASPKITTQPQSQTVATTANASLIVAATGTAPFGYQWCKSGVNIVGATNSILSLSNIQPNQAGDYTVVITNGYGSVTSSVAVITVVNLVLSLSSNGQYAAIPSSLAIQPGNAITVELWFLPLLAPGITNSVVLNKGDGLTASSERSYEVDWGPSNGISFQLFLGSSTWAGITVPAPVNQWVHCAATYDSATSRINIFTNGILAASTTNDAGGSPLNGRKVRQTTLPLTFGLIPGLGNTYFNGSIDEVRIWNTARSGAEIFRDFHARLTGTETGLVGYWHFDGGTVADVTTNANNGTLAAGAQIVPISGADIPHIGAPTIAQLPQSLSVASGTNVTFAVAATSTAPLIYQWLKDGVVLTGQTNAQLNLPTLTNRASGGSFSVVVSNLYGSATGNVGSLRVRVPHRLLPPVQTNGVLRLLSTDQDGGLLSTNDLPYFVMQSGTNLASTNWVSFSYTNGLLLTNGMLRLDDTNAATRPVRFYRVLEQ